MKELGICLVLIVWMVLTLTLALSIIGIVVLIREDHNTSNFQGEQGEAIWFKIGKGLVNKLIE